jgi:hypothetical protein
MRAVRRALLGAVIGLSGHNVAVADVPAPDAPRANGQPDEARRAAVYREGIQLADAGRWKEAIERFREAIAIRSAPPALFTLAQAEEHAGELATAERTFERALSEARAAGITDVADAAKKSLSSIEPRVPRLTIKVASGVESATATVDGSPAPIGEPVKVNPGDHFVSVSAPGKTTFKSNAYVGEGQSANVAAILPLLSPRGEAVPTGSLAADSDRSALLVPIAIGGTGIVVGAVGLAVRLVGQSRYGSATASCPNEVCPNDAAGMADQATASSARNEEIAGTIVLGVGAAVLASGVVVWLMQPKKTASPAVRAGVSAWAGGPRLTFAGSF